MKSRCERIPFLNCKPDQNFIQYEVYKSRVKYGERERNVTECVVLSSILLLYFICSFIELNLQRREYHFVNILHI